jgi:hypothetical protein
LLEKGHVWSLSRRRWERYFGERVFDTKDDDAMQKSFLQRLGLLKEVREDVAKTAVAFAVVKHSGYHIQNDLYWEHCAGQIASFLESFEWFRHFSASVIRK